ncbi:hypothetical protein BD324DRAFT_634480 [Kockovaella imperatae]|uniref:Uncharacterized protein n=1 Tax=Kockovaella imperatae TaxID=4999 RepID=A0A1Y1U9H6_9TREE|nr:hypothetical protein BD324DRAFT_634480 [Kockovaella imperatae]ORX34683.1 hypothetical protein BD324DRAFT_634480 [Kockovaella imperatae]
MAANSNVSGGGDQPTSPANTTPQPTTDNGGGGGSGSGQGGSNNSPTQQQQPTTSKQDNNGGGGNGGGGNNGGTTSVNSSPTANYTPPSTTTLTQMSNNPPPQNTYTPPTTQAQGGNGGGGAGQQQPQTSTQNNNNYPMPQSSSAAVGDPIRGTSAAVSSYHPSSSIASSSSTSHVPSSSSTISSAISSVHPSSLSSTQSSSSSSSAATALSNDAATSTKSFSKGEIGGIAGGAAGGVALLVLIFLCWRRARDKKNWVPPPPPREMAYNSQSISRHRASVSGIVPSVFEPAGADVHRQSSYSTLLAARPSSQFAHSRDPSTSGYYSTYPIATPSSGSGEPTTSPFMAPVSAYTPASEPSPPLSHDLSPGGGIHARSASTDLGNLAGVGIPAHRLYDSESPFHRPGPLPLAGAARRETDSSSQSGSSSGRSNPPRHKTSVDRLRHETSRSSLAGSNGPGALPTFPSGGTGHSSRAPSPSLPSEGEPSSRATSPNPSTYTPSHAHSFNGMAPRQYISSSLSPFPRPYSTISMNTIGPVNISGAPHQGRRMMLQMPELLSSPRPDDGNDYMRERRSMEGTSSSMGAARNREHRLSANSDFGPVSPQRGGHRASLPHSQSASFSGHQSRYTGERAV